MFQGKNGLVWWLLIASSCTGVEEIPAGVDAGPVESGAEASPQEGGALLGTMTCGDLPVASDSCASCADDHCCIAGKACANDPPCASLRTCLAACPADDTACAEACGEKNAEGKATNAALSACRMRWCGEECFGSSGTECGFQMPSASCNDCAQSYCCDVGWSTNTEPAFWAYQNCVATCTDASCFDGCSAGNPDGHDLYTAFIGCLGTRCASPCGVEPPATCGGFYGATCGPCIDTHCCEASTACLLRPTCRMLQTCVHACAGDSSCITTCKQSAPDEVEAFDALEGCRDSQCADLCP